jgi:hypothetical protein
MLLQINLVELELIPIPRRINLILLGFHLLRGLRSLRVQQCGQDDTKNTRVEDVRAGHEGAVVPAQADHFRRVPGRH